MRIGAAGIALLKEFEQCRLDAYPDEGGVPTIGWGHTGPEVDLGLTWTQDQADAQFSEDIHQRAELPLLHTVTAALSQNQFDAVCCFTYNVGAGNEAHSTLVRLLNAGDLDGAAAEFPKWDKARGVVSAGLQCRRAAEQALFLTP